MAVLQNENEPSITVHYIDEGEDRGDVIFQERVHIPLGTKSPERLDKLIGDVGASLLIKAIRYTIRQSPSNSAAGRQPNLTARNIQPEEHKEIIDWKNWPIERIWHVARELSRGLMP